MNLKQVIALLTNGEWHSIRFLTADLLKQKGGQYLEFNDCRVARREMLVSSANTSSSTGIERPANHNLNFTLNLELKNKQIRKVHPVLITHINNVAVL
jgi:hypothetical protein